MSDSAASVSQSEREAPSMFLTAVVPPEERHLLFTDGATVYDITSLTREEIVNCCVRHYGVEVSAADLQQLCGNCRMA